MLKRILPAVLLTLSLTCAASAQEWGNLSGQFVYDGDPPTPAPANVDKDLNVCGDLGIVEESLLVDEDTGGIANVVVYLYLSPSDTAPEAHPDYEATADAEVHLDNTGCRFEPHITPLRTSQTLVVGNDDPIGHNTKIDPRSNPAVNPVISAQGTFDCTFPKEERLPVPISCSQHPWMTGFLVIKDTPYMAVTDAEGRFTIENLPAGTWTFQVWQESAGYVGGELTIGGESQDWGRRGQFEITIEEGDNDLGEILVPASVFER